jgi:hypothetical protein
MRTAYVGHVDRGGKDELGVCGGEGVDSCPNDKGAVNNT